MTESEFLALADAVLSAVEAALERVAADTDLDIECSRSGNVLEIELIDNGTKIIVNSQAPMQEMWIAAKSGGFHFRHDGRLWIDTRNGGELFSSLSHMLSQQAGTNVALTPAAD